MASQYDESDFVDRDFEPGGQATSTAIQSGGPAQQRAPNREELDTRVTETQQKLAELKQAQEALERERSKLEETRRKRMELETGRAEVTQQITRGLGLLEKAQFERQRDSEQMTRTLTDLKDVLEKVETIHEEDWKPDELQTELTKALTAVENARMEWNSARLKWSLLDGAMENIEQTNAAANSQQWINFDEPGAFKKLCKAGLAVTWPIAAALILGFAAIVVTLFLTRS